MAGIPAPSWLNEEAGEVWERTLDDLPHGAPLDVFALYCSAIADHNQAQRLLNRSGLLVRDSRGGLVPSPLHRVKNANATTARALARDLGIGVDPSVADSPRPYRKFRNTRATERTVEALRSGGKLENVDEAAIALVRTLAQALDTVDAEAYPAQVASLARAHLSAIRLLRNAGEDDHDDGLSDWLTAMSGPMGDAAES